MENLLLVIEVFLGIVLVGCILKQPPQTDVMASFSGRKQESYFEQNKGNTQKYILEKITYITMGLFILNTICIHVL